MHRVLNEINSETKYHRKSSPKDIQKLWKCLQSIAYHKSRRGFVKKLFADNESDFESENQLKTIINNALDDKLVAEEVDQNKAYRLIASVDRLKMTNNSTNDWYCFECHSSSESEDLIGCKDCFRAFHETCLHLSPVLSGQSVNGSDKQLDIQSEDKSLKDCDNQLNGEPEEQMSDVSPQQLKDGSENSEEFTAFPLRCPQLDFECPYCQRYKYPDNIRAKQICGEELNLLIELFYETIEKEYQKRDIDICREYVMDSNLLSNVLIYCPIDLPLIRQKVLKLRKYTSFVEFDNDLRHFFHNFSVLKGKELIQPFIDVIDKEMEELYQCYECYLWNKAAEEERAPSCEWFIRVCNPPHRLVYAKLKGFPYWPSKVLQWDGDSDKCKVQFFEANRFEVAWVPKTKIKEIDYKMESKQLKNPNIVESVALLFRYLKNLRNQDSDLGQEFVFERVYSRLEGVLTRIWRKQGYPFLADLNFESKKKCVRKCVKRKLEESQELSPFKHLFYSNDSSSSQSSVSTNGDISVLSQDLNDSQGSIDSQESALQAILSNPMIKEEDKTKICSLIISFFKDNDSIES